MKLAVILLACFVLALASAIVVEHNGESAGGKQEKGATYSEHKHVKQSGKKSKHDHEKARKGESLKELHLKTEAEGGGHKTAHHSEGGHNSGHDEAGASEHGAKFQEGAKQKKGAAKKGFREKFHKDEYKKHDSFYSKGHQSGDFEVFGEKHAKFNTHHSAKKLAVNHKAAKDANDYKKSHAKAGGHSKSEKKGHGGQKAAKSHHNHQEKWAKKGGKKGGKQYKYKVPPHK